MRMMVAAYGCHLNGDLAAQRQALQRQEAERQEEQQAQLQRQRLQEQERQRLAAQQQAANGAAAQSDTPPPPHSIGNASHGTPALDAAESRDQQAQANQAGLQSYADNATRAASQGVGIQYSGQRSLQIQIMLSPESEFLWVGSDGGNGLSARVNVDVPYWFSDCKDKVCQGVDFRLGGHFGIGFVNSNKDRGTPLLLIGYLRATYWLDRFGFALQADLAAPKIQADPNGKSNVFEQAGPGLLIDLAGASGESNVYANAYFVWKPLLDGGSSGDFEAGIEVALGAFMFHAGGASAPANTQAENNGQPVAGSKANSLGYKEGFLDFGFLLAK